jgi:hypothetical protein
MIDRDPMPSDSVIRYATRRRSLMTVGRCVFGENS